MTGKWGRADDERKKQVPWSFLVSPPYDREKLRRSLQKTLGPKTKSFLQESPVAQVSPRKGTRNRCPK
jgi:hypothetical protein